MDDDELPEALSAALEHLRDQFDAEVRQRSDQPLAYAEDYVDSALVPERDLLDHRVPTARRPSEVELLVLLCGTSAAPLLLSTSFVRPKRVMLVASSSNLGRDAMKLVDEKLRQVERKLGSTFERVAPCEIAPSDPTQAYRQLADAIRVCQRELDLSADQILVDITGGKKTMVAAAFLVCSELGLKSSYVDADYDERARMPVPGSADYVLLRDPIAAFRVRELAEVVTLTRCARYQAAASLLRRLIEDELAVPRASLKDALTKLRWLEAWSDRRMGELADAPGELGALGKRWMEQSRKKDWSLSACAKVDDGRLLSRFAVHQVAYAVRLARGRERSTVDAFLVAFAVCDSLADGVLTLVLESKRLSYEGEEKLRKNHREFVKKVGGEAATDFLKVGKVPCGFTSDGRWRGVGEETFDAALGHADLRPVRNTLMHGIGEPDHDRIGRFFDDAAPQRFVEGVERALGRDFDVVAKLREIDDVVDRLEHEVEELLGAGR